MAALMRAIGKYGFNPADFDIVQENVSIRRLDSKFNGYRIVHISDLHIGQWLSPERLKGVVQLVNEQKPDIVAITGDFVSFAVNEVAEDLARSLSKLRPNDATLAVLGNHDHWTSAEKVRNILRESDVTNLANSVYTVQRGNAELQFAGLDDVMVNQHDLAKVISELDQTSPTILLVHEPDFADVSAATGLFDLQLSGHSHGGQFILPKVGTPFRGSHFKKYPAGRYQVGNMVLYTNRGLGTNTFWIRINCKPEVTVLALRGNTPQDS